MPALDLIGVGIGPFNLSLAALLSPQKNVRSVFFDQSGDFVWHQGMLLADSEIQVSYLKDLVTLVDPTNPYSFLAFLSQKKRLYRFLNARFPRVLRSEFNQYLHWASHNLPNLYFDERVQEIDFNFSDGQFVVKTAKREAKCKNLVLGSGLSPFVPACARAHIGIHVYHNKDFLHHSQDWSGKRVAVIGGGQSGAEIFYALLSNKILPSKLLWAARRKLFFPIDDSVFANELFTPAYTEHFYQLPATQRYHLLQQQTLASDGISEHLLEAIYQKLYAFEFLEERGRFFELLPNHELINIQDAGSHKILELNHVETLAKKAFPVDVIILCTGYHQHLPSYANPLIRHCALEENRFTVNDDFSVVWNGPPQRRIYVQNGARHSHGVADPNLSLMAWRSAKIINSILEEKIYDIDDVSVTIDWPKVYPPTHLPQEAKSYANNPI